MHATSGDQLIVHGRTTGKGERHGEVLEARGEGGSPPFLVRWDDTQHTTLYFPGTDCEVVSPQSPKG
jgi:Domain of unknown function (DUF1918)